MSMDTGPISGGRMPKPISAPQSGVYGATLRGDTDPNTTVVYPLQLTYLPLAADNITRVRCEGILSLRNRPYGTDPLRDLLGAQCFTHSVLMSLEKVVGAETSGISWLYNSAEKFVAVGGKLILYAVPASVLSLLSLLEIEMPFAIASTEAEARSTALGNSKV